MKNLKQMELQELDEIQLQQIEGGVIGLFIGVIGLAFTAYAAGYMTGKAIF
ncbi:class IIb bacteriocin, lactobin A/cerein 7B family [Labilibaculum euxinus]|nr:class IIb bacteriocin, lactobin A/cerein 7B family [Labilibaculum euxinus]